MKLNIIAAVAILLILVSFSMGFSQQPTDVQNQINQLMPQPVPPSPNVASLGKFGDYQVGYFSGLPEISIPLYEIKSGDLSIPISLSYHASGIKPTDIASWVGMGWALSAGGQVSRNVQGMPDEQYFYNSSNPVNYNPTVCNNFHYLQDITLNRRDTQADIFSYSMPGGNGKFLLGPNGGTAYPVPATSKQIAPTYVASGASGTFPKFEITDEKGVLCRFGTSSLGASAIEYTSTNNGGVTNGGNNIVTPPSAWHLMEMIAPNTNDQISFIYQNVGTSSTYDVSYVYVIDNQCRTASSEICPFPYQTMQSLSMSSTTNQLGLQTITFKTGKVEFVLGAQRNDASLASLDTINIYSLLNGAYNLEKTIKFVYSYYTLTGPTPGPLQLTAVQFLDNKGALIEQYKLNYNTNYFSWNPTAANFWNARDLWGFFNGAYQNTDLVLPKTIGFQQAGLAGLYPVSPITFGGAVNRAVNTTYSQEGVLNQITYPTGGYTQFTFEQNQYLNGSTPTLAGGLRLKQFVSNDGSGSNSVIKTYKYGDNESGYGIANFSPYQFNYSGNQDVWICGSSSAEYTALTYYSNSAFSSDPFDSSPVLYPHVTEYLGDPTATTSGKTIYVFDNEVPQRDVNLVVPFSSKYYSDSFFWKRGHLTNKTVFDASGNLLAETDISYYNFKATDNIVGLGVNQYVAQGAIAASGCNFQCYDEDGEPVNSNSFVFSQFFQSSGSMEEVQRNEYTYQAGNTANYVLKQTTTAYDPNFLVQVQTTVSRSDNNQQEVTVNRYPFLFSPPSNSTGNALGMYLLNKKNIVSAPIETYSYLQNPDGTNARVISGHITSFRQNVTNVNNVVPDQIYSWESKSTEPLSAYVPCSLNTNNSGLILDTNYNPRINFVSYDNFGNLQQVSKVNDVQLSYKYGYNNSLPIAQVKNAQNISGGVVEFFSENFEENTSTSVVNNPSVAHSGTRYFGGQYTANFTLPNSRAYVIEYFYLDVSNVWHHILKPYTGPSSTLTDGSSFDDVRIYPKDAQKSSYTYDSILGITSVIDEAGILRLYDYDAFGRLKRVRNNKGTIEKQYLYNYKEID